VHFGGDARAQATFSGEGLCCEFVFGDDSSDFNQLCLIMDVIGTPDDSDVEEMGSSKTRAMLKKLPNRPKVPFAKLYPRANSLG
jgi:hypothetical protein